MRPLLGSWLNRRVVIYSSVTDLT